MATNDDFERAKGEMYLRGSGWRLLNGDWLHDRYVRPLPLSDALHRQRQLDAMRLVYLLDSADKETRDVIASNVLSLAISAFKSMWSDPETRAQLTAGFAPLWPAVEAVVRAVVVDEMGKGAAR